MADSQFHSQEEGMDFTRIETASGGKHVERDTVVMENALSRDGLQESVGDRPRAVAERVSGRAGKKDREVGTHAQLYHN